MRLEITHAAGFGDEVRRLRERHRVKAAADAIGRFEQTHAEVRRIARQPPGCVNTGDAAADNRDVEFWAYRRCTRAERRQSERGAAG